LNAIFTDETLRQARFDLRAGSKSGITPIATGPLTFSNVTTGSDAVKIATYYTADPSNLSNVQVRFNALSVRYPNGRVEQLVVSGSPLTHTVGNFTRPRVGMSLNGSVNLLRVISGKRILHVSTDIIFGYSAGDLNRASYRMLYEPRNFGNQTNSIFRMQPFVRTRVSSIAASDRLLVHLRATPRPDIVIIALFYPLNTDEITELANYVRAGGVLILMIDSAPDVAQSNQRRNVLRNIFNTAAIDWTRVNGSGAVYQLPNINDRILNGPFGDIRNLFRGEDANSTTSLTGVPTGNITIYTGGNAINYSNQSNPGITMFKHN
ncbi:hypothetical protein M8994_20215, partial [Brucella sp. 21LCYQ03]|nr:hypothetical protein [Brucella sp. 21LCYQ03]